MRKRLSLIVLAASVSFIAACGSKTVYPDGSVVGTMTTGTLPEVTIDGQAMRLAPGARIYNESNLTITPNQLPPNSRVRYKTNEAGQVYQVRVLPAER